MRLGYGPIQQLGAHPLVLSYICPRAVSVITNWQAATTGKNPSTKATMDAVKKWEAALDSIGGSKAAVQVEDAVGSFLWHCGIFNVLGMQADGSSKLEKHRQQAMKVKTTCSVGF